MSEGCSSIRKIVLTAVITKLPRILQPEAEASVCPPISLFLIMPEHHIHYCKLEYCIPSVVCSDSLCIVWKLRASEMSSEHLSYDCRLQYLRQLLV